MFVINRNILFPDACLRLRVDRSELGEKILDAGQDVTFIATGLEQALLCHIVGISEGYLYTGTASRLPEFIAGDKVLVISLEDNNSYLYTVNDGYGTPRILAPNVKEKNLILP